MHKEHGSEFHGKLLIFIQKWKQCSKNASSKPNAGNKSKDDGDFVMNTTAEDAEEGHSEHLNQ